MSEVTSEHISRFMNEPKLQNEPSERAAGDAMSEGFACEALRGGRHATVGARQLALPQSTRQDGSKHVQIQLALGLSSRNKRTKHGSEMRAQSIARFA